MSTQYRLVQSGKTASGGCSAGQGSSEPVAPRIFFYLSLFKQIGTYDVFEITVSLQSRVKSFIHRYSNT
jgi:hypothetical protein